MMMSETVLNKPKRKNTADYEALAEINSLEEQMNKDHAESEHLKAETQVIKAHCAATLSQLHEQINRLSNQE